MGKQIRAKVFNIREDSYSNLEGDLAVQIVNPQGFHKRELVFRRMNCYPYYGFDTLHYHIKLKGCKFIFADPLAPKGFENKLIIKVEPINPLKKIWWKLRRYDPIYHD